MTDTALFDVAQRKWTFQRHWTIFSLGTWWCPQALSRCSRLQFVLAQASWTRWTHSRWRRPWVPREIMQVSVTLMEYNRKNSGEHKRQKETKITERVKWIQTLQSHLEIDPRWIQRRCHSSNLQKSVLSPCLWTHPLHCHEDGDEEDSCQGHPRDNPTFVNAKHRALRREATHHINHLEHGDQQGNATSRCKSRCHTCPMNLVNSTHQIGMTSGAPGKMLKVMVKTMHTVRALQIRLGLKSNVKHWFTGGHSM